MLNDEHRRAIASAYSLEGHTALITGGATGIGFGIARAYTESGARVVLLGRREDALRDACAALGEAAHWRACDLQALETIPSLVDEIGREVAAPSLLVHAAGIHAKQPLDSTTDEDFARMWRVHVAAGFALARALHDPMLSHREVEGGSGGHILWIASMASYLGLPQVSAYAAAKSAVTGLVRSLASELAPDGIRVNAVAPGWIDTPLLQQALAGDDDRRNRILARTPMNRLGTPEEVGRVAAFLASPAASFITGTIVPVDGGALIGM